MMPGTPAIGTSSHSPTVKSATTIAKRDPLSNFIAAFIAKLDSGVDLDTIKHDLRRGVETADGATMPIIK